MGNRSRRRIHITGPARRDISAILRWSLQEFGEDAALRYEALIFHALRDIQEDPERPGAKQRPEIASDILVYHLRYSRDTARAAVRKVRTPRHFVIFRLAGHSIEVLRVLHDARELDRHFLEAYRGSSK